MTTKLALSMGAALLLLTGCSAAQDAAQDAAGNAAAAAKAKAAQKASDAVSSVVQDQICSIVGDNRVSKADITRLSSLLDQADAAGLDSAVLQPLRDVVDSGEAKADDVRALQESCPSS